MNNHFETIHQKLETIHEKLAQIHNEQPGKQGLANGFTMGANEVSATTQVR